MKRLILTSIILLACGSFVGCAKRTEGPSRNLHAATTSELASWESSKKTMEALNRYVVAGKFAYSQNGKGGSADVRWHQEPNKYTIEINPPLGSNSIKIVGQPGNYSLMKQTGEIAVASTPEKLLAQTLKLDLPISGLQYWAKGIPAPGTPPTKVLFNSNHQLGQIEQHGWMIDYENFTTTNGIMVPEKMTLVNGSIKLKLIFNRWEFSGK